MRVVFKYIIYTLLISTLIILQVSEVNLKFVMKLTLEFKQYFTLQMVQLCGHYLITVYIITYIIFIVSIMFKIGTSATKKKKFTKMILEF